MEINLKFSDYETALEWRKYIDNEIENLMTRNGGELTIHTDINSVLKNDQKGIKATVKDFNSIEALQASREADSQFSGEYGADEIFSEFGIELSDDEVKALGKYIYDHMFDDERLAQEKGESERYFLDQWINEHRDEYEKRSEQQEFIQPFIDKYLKVDSQGLREQLNEGAFLYCIWNDLVEDKIDKLNKIFTKDEQKKIVEYMHKNGFVGVKDLYKEVLHSSPITPIKESIKFSYLVKDKNMQGGYRQMDDMPLYQIKKDLRSNNTPGKWNTSRANEVFKNLAEGKISNFRIEWEDNKHPKYHDNFKVDVKKSEIKPIWDDIKPMEWDDTEKEWETTLQDTKESWRACRNTIQEKFKEDITNFLVDEGFLPKKHVKDLSNPNHDQIKSNKEAGKPNTNHHINKKI